MEGIDNIIPEMVQITKDIKNAFPAFFGAGRNILGIGTLFWIFSQGWRLVAKGELNSLSDALNMFAKPIFLSALLIMYSPCLSLLEFFGESAGQSTQGWAISYMEKNKAMEVKYKADLVKTLTGVDEKKMETLKPGDPVEPSGFTAIAKDIGDMFDSIYNFFVLLFSVNYWVGMIVGVLNSVISFCLQVSYLSILVLQGINLCILTAFGPIAIAVSIFNPFNDNWKAFFANYFNKLLWFPIANMTLGIAYRLKNISDQHSYDTLLTFAKFTSGTSTLPGSTVRGVALSIYTIDFVPVFLSIGVTIIGIFAVSKTPSFANLIISGATGGMDSSPLSGGAIIGTAMLATKMVVGGVTSAVSLGGKALSKPASAPPALANPPMAAIAQYGAPSSNGNGQSSNPIQVVK